MMATTAKTDVPICPSMVPGVDRMHSPRKRVLTEARRKQNLVNQRTYRQKQRAKCRQSLQHQCQGSSAKKPELRPRPTNHRPEDKPVNESASTLEHIPPTAASESEPLQEQRTIISPLVDVATPQVELPLPMLASDPLTFPLSTTSLPFSSVDFSFTCNPTDLDFSCPGTYGDLVPSALSSSNDTVSIQDENETSPRALEVLDPREPSAATQNWSATQDMSLLSLAPLSDISTQFRSDNLHYNQSPPDEIITNQIFDLDRVVAAGLEALLCGRQPTGTSQIISSNCRLPNPRMNGIQFSPTRILLACLQNAQSMGFLAQDAIMPRCVASSPFHRSVTPADDPKKLLAVITTPSTPIHLKPTLPQILYPHPAFMDLIPIPVFRARAITLAATQPQLFDIWELKKDMFVKDGLVLWSSMSSGASSGGVSMGQGQPWDMRSWEAAPWFLRKWRMLIDGEEGELWKQSLWWQRARE